MSLVMILVMEPLNVGQEKPVSGLHGMAGCFHVV